MINKTGRIKEFTFVGADAWGWVHFYAVLETRLDGICICVADTRESRVIQIDDVDEFVQKIDDTGINDVNGKKFYELVEDGGSWMLHLLYDDKDILTAGENAMPDEVIKLLNLLGYEEKLNSRSRKKSIRSKRIKSEERISLLCEYKDRNRLKRELWGDKPSYAPTFQEELY